jgi:hypothetical protein
MTNTILLSSEIGCSSFGLKKTTRGYTWSIKVYNSDIKTAYDQAKTIDTQAAQDYQIAESDGE